MRAPLPTRSCQARAARRRWPAAARPPAARRWCAPTPAPPPAPGSAGAAAWGAVGRAAAQGAQMGGLGAAAAARAAAASGGPHLQAEEAPVRALVHRQPCGQFGGAGKVRKRLSLETSTWGSGPRACRTWGRGADAVTRRGMAAAGGCWQQAPGAGAAPRRTLPGPSLCAPAGRRHGVCGSECCMPKRSARCRPESASAERVWRVVSRRRPLGPLKPKQICRCNPQAPRPSFRLHRLTQAPCSPSTTSRTEQKDSPKPRPPCARRRPHRSCRRASCRLLARSLRRRRLLPELPRRVFRLLQLPPGGQLLLLQRPQRGQQARLLALAPPPRRLVAPPHLLQLFGAGPRRVGSWCTCGLGSLRAGTPTSPLQAVNPSRSPRTCCRPCSAAAAAASWRAAASITGSLGARGATCERWGGSERGAWPRVRKPEQAVQHARADAPGHADRPRLQCEPDATSATAARAPAPPRTPRHPPCRCAWPAAPGPAPPGRRGWRRCAPGAPAPARSAPGRARAASGVEGVRRWRGGR